jgi:hypothetical protein
MSNLAAAARNVVLGAILCAGAMGAGPAYAAAEDVALLKEYLGNWKGRGTLTGAETETVVCRLSMVDGNDDKVNYAGRCSLAGTTLSINGTIAFIDASNRFEAAMTSNATFTGTAIGRKRGKSIVFDLKEKQKDEEGNEMTVSARLVLSDAKINVNFQVLFNATGDIIKAEVPFSQ